MKKRLLALSLCICFIFTMLMTVPVFAAGSITINKTEFTAGEKGEASVKGLTQDEIDGGAYLGIAKKGTKPGNVPCDIYVYDLPEDNIYEFRAPNDLGTYEIFLLNWDGSVFNKKEFTVGAQKAKAGDITLSKSEVKLGEPITVTVKGLTNEQIDNGAWFGFAEWDQKLENTIMEAYVYDMSVENKYESKAPDRFGKYEVRVFSHDSYDYEATLFGKAEFLVVSSKAKAGDIVLSKTTVSPEEKISVTVKGLSKGEIEAGAWLGIVPANEKLENTIIGAYISDLPVGNVYEFTAPYTPGTYEVRVFCSSLLSGEEYEYGKFGTVQFTVSGDAAPSDDFSAGYEGLSGWAAPVVNEARSEDLVTDKVLVDFPADITREEFCELAVLLYEKMTGEKAAPVASNPFTDTKNPEILKAYNLKIVNGISADKFAPNNKVTRQEISVMLLRTLKAVMPDISSEAEFKTKFQDVDDVANWALEAVRFMNANGILGGSSVGGVTYILPKGNTTKEQAIALVLRLYNAFYKI